ncbi:MULTISPECIES: flagellar protein FlgN [unclassified Endozoicomonas]|uniref:flagellar protein FlgN n=1 Tax=unclassified Endozoicomonas TaxID=2644528 RepID=UPI002147D3F3|nr:MULTISPECIES: flagellar protein FlgN [unclassified Endozoicomonas]
MTLMTTEKNDNKSGTYSVSVEKKLLGNIRDALALTRKLEVVLSKAHNLMLERNIAALETHLETQVKLLDMLHLNASLREHYLKEAGLSPDPAGIRSFLQIICSTPKAEATLKQWHQLEITAGRCRSLNQANGKLLSRLAASTNQIIDVVFSSQEPSPYNQQGICERKLG